MRRCHHLRLLSAITLLSTALVLGAQSRAHALAIKLTSGATTFTCADGDGCDLDPTAGIVSAQSSLGGTVVSSMTTGTAKPAIGSPSAADLDLSIVTTFGGGKTVNVFISDVGYVGLGSQLFNFAIGGTNRRTGDSVTVMSYIDAANALFGTTTLIGQLGPFVSDSNQPQHFGDTQSFTALSEGEPHSLTIQAVVNHALEGLIRTTSFDVEVTSTNVPEPSSLLLLGSGLLGLGWLRRKRPR